MTESCYSKQKCVVAVSNQTFQDPCFPGTRKYLSVVYSCGKTPSAPSGRGRPQWVAERVLKASQREPGIGLAFVSDLVRVNMFTH